MNRITDRSGYDLVSKKKRPAEAGRVWQHECDGCYIYSNISNGTKRDEILKISNCFHLVHKMEEGIGERGSGKSFL